jgi:O-antigen/teichoic acid export membrane protein
VPLCAALAGCAAVLLKAWMGPDYVAAAPVLQALLAGFAVSIFNHAGYSAMLGMRRIGGLLPRYYIPQAVLNLGLSLALVGPLGPLGVALGTAIPALALEYVFVRYLLRTVDLSGSAFFGSSVLPVLWPVVAFVPLALAYAVMGPEWLGLVPLAAACGLAYAALFWLRSLSAAERLQLLGLVRARLWRQAPQGASPEP